MKQTLQIPAVKIIVVVALLLVCNQFLFAQNIKPLPVVTDTTPVKTSITVKKVDTTKDKDKKIDSVLKNHSPRVAAIRSAIFPGLGQIYNKKYWKLPIIYGGVGAAAGIFIFNIKTYHEYRFAYNARYKAALPIPDSTDYNTLAPIYKIVQPESIRAARNQIRQKVDYSVLFFILMWGLNVVDATVDAHLKAFDVSPNLSLNIVPGHSELANTNGLSLVLNIGNNKRNR